MHPAGQCSWRVGIESSSSLLDIALFTRDACGLDVPADARVPPPVATTVRDRRDALAPALRSPAGAQWLSWWVALVAQVGAVQLGSLVLPASTHQRLETLAALDQGLFDWPDLDALATRPALRKAVRAVGAEARRWSGEQRRKVALDTRAGDPSPIAHTAVRDAAEATMTRYAVPPRAGPGRHRGARRRRPLVAYGRPGSARVLDRHCVGRGPNPAAARGGVSQRARSARHGRHPDDAAASLATAVGAPRAASL